MGVNVMGFAQTLGMLTWHDAAEAPDIGRAHWHEGWNIDGDIRVIQPERFSTESAKTKLSYKYWIKEAEWFGPILQIR